MTGKKGNSPESIVREIKRQTHRKFTAEEKIRIVFEGFRGKAIHRKLSSTAKPKERRLEWRGILGRAPPQPAYPESPRLLSRVTNNRETHRPMVAQRPHSIVVDDIALGHLFRRCFINEEVIAQVRFLGLMAPEALFLFPMLRPVAVMKTVFGKLFKESAVPMATVHVVDVTRRVQIAADQKAFISNAC